MGNNLDFKLFKRSPQYRSFGECAIVHLLKKNYPTLNIQVSNRDQLNGYELDIWLPDLNIGIEYNGQHHFKPVYGEKIYEKTKQSDKKKNDIAIEKGIKIIYIIPDGSISHTSKNKIINLFKKCCCDLGFSNPSILSFNEQDVLDEQKNNKPKHNKFINLGRIHSEETKKKMSDMRSKIYTLKSPTGEIVTVNKLKQFCIEHDIQYTWLLTQFKKGNPCKGWIKL
jgi:hypothetical protein